MICLVSEQLIECIAGLLCTLIGILMEEPSDSQYRFWIASCIEAFLRGSNAASQLLVARTGLLEHLLAEVQGHDRRVDVMAHLRLLFGWYHRFCRVDCTPPAPCKSASICLVKWSSLITM